MRLLPVLAATAALAPAAAVADTWFVTPDGSGDFPTIQDAIAAAAAGDVILLADGVFTGEGNCNIRYLGKNVVVRSASGNADACVIDGEYLGMFESGVHFTDGEGPEAVLRDVTVQHFMEPPIRGGLDCFSAICVWGASPTLRGVVVRENPLGLVVIDSNSRVEGCRIEENGTGVQLAGGAPLLTGCVIAANSHAGTPYGSGIVCSSSGSATIANCLVTGSRGLATVYGSGFTMRECVVTGNANDVAGATVWVSGVRIESCTVTRNAGRALVAKGPVQLDRTILWGTCGSEEAFVDTGATLTLACSDVPLAAVVGPGVVIDAGGNVDVAPRFCAPDPCGVPPSPFPQYTLQLVSPLRDVPGCGRIGALDVSCTVAVSPSSWGRTKALYR